MKYNIQPKFVLRPNMQSSCLKEIKLMQMQSINVVDIRLHCYVIPVLLVYLIQARIGDANTTYTLRKYG